MEERRR
jgi:hypothetical protein